MNCPDRYTPEWGKELVAHLGGDVSKIGHSDCLMDICPKFPDLKEKVIEFFLHARTGDPAGAAYIMRCANYISTDEAMRIIGNAKTGDPEKVALLMFGSGCLSGKEYGRCLQRIKTNVKSGK